MADALDGINPDGLGGGGGRILATWASASLTSGWSGSFSGSGSPRTLLADGLSLRARRSWMALDFSLIRDGVGHSDFRLPARASGWASGSSSAPLTYS